MYRLDGHVQLVLHTGLYVLVLIDLCSVCVCACVSTLGNAVSCATTGIDPAASTLQHSTVEKALTSLTLR